MFFALFPRIKASSYYRGYWIPAFAGMTTVVFTGMAVFAAVTAVVFAGMTEESAYDQIRKADKSSTMLLS